MSRTKYKNDPIEEALCEIRFSPESPWDLTIPGTLANQLRGSHPQRRQQQELNVMFQGAVGAPPSNVAFQQGVGRLQLLSQDGSTIVAIAPNVISIHALRPYPGWEALQPLIKQIFNEYLELANPLAVDRIGVRYINRITVPVPGASPSDYFKTSASNMPGFLRPLAFFHRDEYSIGHNRKAFVTQASVDPQNPESTNFILDIDVVHEGRIETGDALVVAGDLRESERDIFESIITDASRGIFNE